MPPHGHADQANPRGVARVAELPESAAVAAWDHLFLAAGMKERLLSQALFSLAHRHRLRSERTALHGLLVLAGPPGTGKTTTARALASMAATRLAAKGDTTLVEIDPHGLPSEMFGESQRNVAKLLGSALPELAGERRFTICIVDEIEALAVRRSTASFDTNPADLHRATDAVLTGLDGIAANHPQLLIIATTNFPAAVDEAVLSRADLVVGFDPPDHGAAAAILRDTLDELAGLWPGLATIADDEARLAQLATACAGLDGRRLRKLVLSAITLRPETAVDPSRLTFDDLFVAADAGQSDVAVKPQRSA